MPGLFPRTPLPYFIDTLTSSDQHSLFLFKECFVRCNFFFPTKIWDTAGQEKYHSLAPMYYRGAGAAIVVYDITKMHSFRTLKEWINELRAQGPQDIAIAIAGNKRDLEADRVSTFHPAALFSHDSALPS